jgi:hypothetical protein
MKYNLVIHGAVGVGCLPKAKHGAVELGSGLDVVHDDVDVGDGLNISSRGKVGHLLLSTRDLRLDLRMIWTCHQQRQSACRQVRTVPTRAIRATCRHSHFDLTRNRAIGLSWRVVGYHWSAGPALATEPKPRPAPLLR